MPEGKQGRLNVWWQALRYHYIPPSIFAAALGGIISWAIDSSFSFLYFLLVLLGVIINHVGLNMTDDYYDYKQSVDRLKPGEKNPYTGGSGTLTSGLINTQAMFKAFVLCYFFTIAVGTYLTLMRGWLVLAFGVFGGLSSIFYTSPPIRFSHRGLGELGLLLNFGTIIGLGSYFVQAQKLSLEAFLATLPLGIMMFSMIVINEIPDYGEDMEGGKLTLVARYGKEAGIKLYIISLLLAYLVIVTAVIVQATTALILIALLSAPIALRSIQTLRKHYKDPIKMAPANLDMIKVHNLTAILLITAYGVEGIMKGVGVTQLLPALLLTALFYAPVALKLIKS